LCPSETPFRTESRSSTIEGDYDDPGPDNTLGPSESLDSDEVRNDDGDIVVDAPLRWIPPTDHLSLSQRLLREERDVGFTDDELLPELRPAGRHRGQISGAPEDGESFYGVAREEFDYEEDD
jgi:hypothetical protein